MRLLTLGTGCPFGAGSEELPGGRGGQSPAGATVSACPVAQRCLRAGSVVACIQRLSPLLPFGRSRPCRTPPPRLGWPPRPGAARPPPARDK